MFARHFFSASLCKQSELTVLTVTFTETQEREKREVKKRESSTHLLRAGRKLAHALKRVSQIKVQPATFCLMEALSLR